MQKFGSPHPSKATLASFGFNLPHSKKNDLMGVLKTHLLHKIQPASQHLLAGFYSNTFVYSRFSPKIWFLYCLFSSVAPWSDLTVVTKGKILEIQVIQIAGKCIFLGFFLGFQSFMGIFEETLPTKIHTYSFALCVFVSI